MKVWSNTNTLTIPYDLETQSKKEADILLVGSKKFDLNEFPKVNTIFRCGVGTDNIDFELAEKRGVKIIMPSERTKNELYQAVSNFTIYMFLTMQQNTYSFKTWGKGYNQRKNDVNVMVVGSDGNIGSRVVRTLHSLGIRVAQYDITAGFTKEEFENLIQWSDYITLHVPLNETTKNMFNKERLDMMKRGSCLINTARAGIVDYDALFRKLADYQLRAALDVFPEEPFRSEDWDVVSRMTIGYQRQLMMTPHCAGNSQDVINSMQDDFNLLIGYDH